MNARHLASDETLAGFSAGRLDEGMSLVVAAHLEINAASAKALREIEAVGGGVLAQGEAVPMLTSAEDALARLDREPGEAPVPVPVRAVEAGLPQVLQPYELGRWHPIGRGVAMRRVHVPGAQARVFMLRAAPGIWLPEHRHTGNEWTTILAGAYEHEYGRFGRGDFDEANENHEHHPRVDAVEGCTCIVALTGEVRFRGWLGRLLQPLVRL
ncbi:MULTISPECIES: ChrR family anti-sigma-E factor [unclassified Bosea (in: a-proteobacteria)]|jgi:putative transcriptional regulator|uniref:ChrR family anti-sigma-E factor n=1 Tax=unclassified Bosea (in: a-proteobacteria) TaxID=2653178 RepID=UPI002DDC9232|nr:ChrR family anti-sigma-E factor [Bosea sp. (in: a-proteobacteria)]HEV2552615.1 ChrR family anti-sigma-E factor [Bosea sp. (in: a-proteobacteria)]